MVEGLDFSNGVIEAEIAEAFGSGSRAGRPGLRRHRVPAAERDEELTMPSTCGPPTAAPTTRSGVTALVQYIGHPAWPWFRLRKETPAKYESYVDLTPGAWTKVKIEARGAAARLYVHGQEQPTLVVNDVKSGAQAKGAVALWHRPGHDRHFLEESVGSQPLP